MERRVLLAISLSFLVLFAYQTYFAPKPSSPAPDVPVGAPATLPGQAPPAAPGGPALAVQPAPTATPQPPPVAVVVGDRAERDITVETGTLRAVFTNRGARLKSWVLKNYRNDAGEPLNLVPDPDNVNDALQPFSLRFDDAGLTSRVNGALFGSPAPATVDATGSPATISFEWQDAEGMRVTKAFTLQPDGFVVEVAISATRGTEVLNPGIDWGPGLGDDIANAPPGKFLRPSYSTPAQALLHQNNSVTRFTASAPGNAEGSFLYAGMDDHYFTALILNIGPQASPFRFDHTSFVVPPKSEGAPPGRYAAFGVHFDTPPPSMRFYVGPKAFDQLRAIDTEMVRVINFGIFSWLAVPLLGALKWVHGYVGNWGWSIVAITLLINLVMFPLRQRSVSSMRKMQEIQPQMKAIQARYANFKITDPQRQKMNEEVMALYKEKGVNPASGCVPMLLTFPFLFAFYAMLSQAIEIRGADFVGWITDLSRPDPLFITPVLMGATMFWQQRLTPTSADPVQQRVMMVMPIMFTFMFLSYPSGLVIYWTISNLWAIGQQYLTNTMAPLPAKAKS
ncbi:MAG: membrane protein insertase YidC [Acidobacteria bacterium]|nr:membrane protein insertase YidC [Acidobacteriota bacterium]